MEITCQTTLARLNLVQTLDQGKLIPPREKRLWHAAFSHNFEVAKLPLSHNLSGLLTTVAQTTVAPLHEREIRDWCTQTIHVLRKHWLLTFRKLLPLFPLSTQREVPSSRSPLSLWPRTSFTDQYNLTPINSESYAGACVVSMSWIPVTDFVACLLAGVFFQVWCLDVKRDCLFVYSLLTGPPANCNNHWSRE